jgi:lysophospholipase L1-like esterase
LNPLLIDMIRLWRTLCVVLGILGAPTIGLADPLKIVAFGDSTTAPRTNVVTYSEVLAKRFGHSAQVVNKGVGLNTTALALVRFKHDVLDEQPDVVIIQFGINDAAIDVWKTPAQTSPRVAIADYEANVRTFVGKLRATGAKVILMTPNQMRWTPKLLELYGRPPYDPKDERGFNLMLKNYAEVVRSVAREEGTALVDVFAMYEAWETKNGESCAELLLDGMHPNSRGHGLVADVLYDHIDAALSEP